MPSEKMSIKRKGTKKSVPKLGPDLSKPYLIRPATLYKGMEKRLVRVARTEEAEKTLRVYSNSRLVDMSQCPTWGVVSSQKSYQTTARSLALEAGETMHQVFAAVRIWQLWKHQNMRDHAEVTGKRIFGGDRWDTILQDLRMSESHADAREQLQQMAFNVLHTSEWEDDARDSTRTMTNMELASMVYIDERLKFMNNWTVWVHDRKNANALVGIEQVFDVVLHYADGVKIRYVGTIDGLTERQANSEKYVEDNKTANRLDDGWKMSFEMSHQITGYCAASSTVFGFPIMRSRIIGTKIKPTNRGEDCYWIEPVERNEEFIQHWSAWVRFMAGLYEEHVDDFEHAPRFTHSCNRYFRPCALLSFCADTSTGRRMQWDQMVPADRSPSERAVG